MTWLCGTNCCLAYHLHSFLKAGLHAAGLSCGMHVNSLLLFLLLASPLHLPSDCCRFHNIYGPYGTWKGGREKAPAAFCRKVLTSTKDIEMWGDGKQTRR